MTSSKPLCIYHGNCQDGFGAAWAVRFALGSNVEFVSGVHQDAPPDVSGRDVLIVDFSYKRPVIEKMASVAATLLILDHHKSAAEDLAGLFPIPGTVYNPSEMLSYQQENNAPIAVHALFDMKRSGAGITWDYLTRGSPRPRLIDHIEDRDLWRFALPKTREISAALFSYPYDFSLWDSLMSDDMLPHLIVEGGAIDRKHKQDIENLLPVVKRQMVIGGASVPVACLPLTLTSDAGHKMCSTPYEGTNDLPPFAACYWDTSEGRVFSLRSNDGGRDVSEIAKTYGGGGHASAAGFRMPLGWEGDGPCRDADRLVDNPARRGLADYQARGDQPAAGTPPGPPPDQGSAAQRTIDFAVGRARPRQAPPPRNPRRDRTALARAASAACRRLVLNEVRLTYRPWPHKPRWLANGVRDGDLIATGEGRSADEAVATLHHEGEAAPAWVPDAPEPYYDGPGPP